MSGSNFGRAWHQKKIVKLATVKTTLYIERGGGVAVPKRDDIVGLGLKLAIFLVNYQPTA